MTHSGYLLPYKSTLEKTIVTLFYHHQVSVENIATALDMENHEIESAIRICFADLSSINNKSTSIIRNMAITEQ